MTPTDPRAVASLVADLGFLLRRDIPTDGKDALLVIAMRGEPTLRHFDPEIVTFWRTDDRGRGQRAELTLTTPMPKTGAYSWGQIRIADRFGITNTFTSIGGRFAADRTDADTAVVTFTSAGPILARGGHSQADDTFAEEMTAFFGRLIVPIDYVPGAEQSVAGASPAERYAAFLQFELERLTASPYLREAYASDLALVRAEARRLRHRSESAWEGGRRLLASVHIGRGRDADDDPISPVSSASATG